MPKVRPRKFSQTTGLNRSAATKSSKAQKAQKSAPVAKTDEVDQLESSTTAPSQSSPLTEAVMKGLENLAEKFYGGAHSPSDGLKVLLRNAEPAAVDLNKVVSQELRELKASQIARDSGMSKAQAQSLVDNLTLLFAPADS